MSQAPLIAVLDDEQQMRKALSRLLLTQGYRVELHLRGEDLIGSVASCPPDCIILDLHMPGITGFDVLNVLAASEDAPPVIVITGHDEPETAEQVRRLGVAAYLKKPVDEATLFAAIEEAIARAEGKSRSPAPAAKREPPETCRPAGSEPEDFMV